MGSNRKTAIIAGILILLGMVSGILSIAPSIEGVDYLSKVFTNKNQVLIAALFQFFLVPIYIGFALLLYPILKQYKTNLAIGFVGFRLIAGVFQLVGVILLPIFLLLSQEFLKSGNSDLLYFQVLGEMLKLVRDLANHLGVMLATGLGNLMLYYIFYKAKLVPEWLSGWGFFGNVLAMLASFLILFGFIDVISISFAFLTVPLVIQEVVLAIFLIKKGLNSALIKHDSEL
jgi:hypothetical protein